MILLTGSTGFVGRHLKPLLERQGYEILCYTRDMDLSSLSSSRPNIKTVINCAGEITDQTKMFEANVVLVERLLRFAREMNVAKFIQIGSSSEYGVISEPRKEDMRCVPTDWYSATKIAATNLCLGYAYQ